MPMAWEISRRRSAAGLPHDSKADRPMMLRRSSPACLAALVCAIAVVPASANASDAYVDRNSIGGACSDTRLASQVTAATPWCTTARAIAAADEGATVLVRAGAYPGLTAVGVGRQQLLTLKAMPGESVTLTGTSTSNTDLTTRAVYFKNSSNLRLEGMKITGGAYIHDSSNVQFAGNEITTIGMRLRNVSDALIADNEFHEFVGSTRALETTANVGEPGVVRLTIRGNEVHATEYDAISLYWRLQDVLVEDNYIHDVRRPAGSDLHTDALQIAPQSEGSWGSVIVRRNRITDYDQGILVKDGATNGLVIENNVIGQPRVFAMHVYSAPNVRITNNTVAGGNLYLRARTTGATVTNNILQKFAIDPTATVALTDYNLVDRTLHNPGYVPGANDLNGRPTFVDPAADDYRLTPTSVGVNAGTSAHNAPMTDVVNQARPSGGAFDMGAYEFQVQPPPPPFGISDSFAGTAGMLLSSHTGEENASWTRHAASGTGTASITAAGMARQSGTGTAGYIASGASTSPEYSVEAAVTIRSSLSARACITARVDPASATFYAACYDQGAKAWQLVKSVAGSQTTLGQFAERLPTAAVRAVKLVVRNASKKVLVNDVERISSTDNAITAAGRAGVYFSGKPVSDTSGAHLDDYRAAPVTP